MDTKIFIKSKFRSIRIFLNILASITVAGFLSGLLYIFVMDMDELNTVLRTLITSFPIVVTVIIFRLELPKIKRIEIDNHSVTITSPFFGGTLKFQFEQLDGYRNITEIRRIGQVQQIFLTSNKEVVLVISENYIKNYNEIRDVLITKLEKLDSIDFDYFRYFKKSFFN